MALKDEILNKLDEHNRYVIDLTINDDASFLSPFSGENKVISSEVASYLDNAIKFVPAKLDISLHIKALNINEEEKIIYMQAIKNYYRNIMTQLNNELIFNLIVSLSMFFIGVIVIAIMIILSSRGLNEIWDVVLEIIGWVFIWEAVDKFFFERRKLKLEILKAKQFINAKIIFIK